MAGAPTLLCFRRDLRLADQPALSAALARGGPVLPVYVHEDDGDWRPGAASRWWLHHSLVALDADLRARGSRLLLRRGALGPALLTLARETGATAVHWTRRVEPDSRAGERKAERELAAAGIALRAFAGDGLHPPDALLNKSGAPYRVFTPYWKALAALPPAGGLASAPEAIPAPADWPASPPLGELELLPRIDWVDGLAAAWTPGEAAARSGLARFLAEAAAGYPEGRDLPGRAGVSRLSPHLHFGEIAPARLWRELSRWDGPRPAAEAWLRQLGWRDFGRHLLWHFPATADAPLNARFERFPWREDPDALRAWQRGETGYAMVDAGMRELWATGWMHNRSRMVTASFLTKHLLVDWRVGARWFWDTLVDADLANNTLGWQWTAGCGADAAPYFRVFSPDAQAKRFDADGAYRLRWARALEPEPIVKHRFARERALAAYERIRTRDD